MSANVTALLVAEATWAPQGRPGATPPGADWGDHRAAQRPGPSPGPHRVSRGPGRICFELGTTARGERLFLKIADGRDADQTSGVGGRTGRPWLSLRTYLDHVLRLCIGRGGCPSLKSRTNEPDSRETDHTAYGPRRLPTAESSAVRNS
jgi:hypothetical protein